MKHLRSNFEQVSDELKEMSKEEGTVGIGRDANRDLEFYRRNGSKFTLLRGDASL